MHADMVGEVDVSSLGEGGLADAYAQASGSQTGNFGIVVLRRANWSGSLSRGCLGGEISIAVRVGSQV